MKKIWITLILSLLLTACNSVSNEEEQYELYKTMYQNILNTTSFLQSSNHFSVSATLEVIEEGKYRYDVFIDEAKVAMYDIEILVIVDEGLLVISDQMMPSIGIYGSKEYSMIPYQVNADLNYMEGFNLNGVINDRRALLKIQVSWKDYFKIRSYKENFEIEVSA